jgi:hypothetical protein
MRATPILGGRQAQNLRNRQLDMNDPKAGKKVKVLALTTGMATTYMRSLRDQGSSQHVVVLPYNLHGPGGPSRQGYTCLGDKRDWVHVGVSMVRHRPTVPSLCPTQT